MWMAQYGEDCRWFGGVVDFVSPVLTRGGGLVSSIMTITIDDGAVLIAPHVGLGQSRGSSHWGTGRKRGSSRQK